VALGLMLAACHGSSRREADMGPLAFRELYSGTGSVAGRADWMIVVHTKDAWRRIAPSLQAQQDLTKLQIDWSKSVALLIQTQPSGTSTHTFHIASLSASAAGVEVRVELKAAGQGPGPSIGTPVLKPSLIVAEADAAPFGEAAPVQLELPGIRPPPSAVAHER
jgi:hypothetical protein